MLLKSCTSCGPCELRSGARSPFAGFTEDGKAAIAASPDYFLAWYSAKSILLVGVIALAAYQFGRSRR